MCVFVGWVDVEHGEPLAIGDSRVMVRRPVLEKHWAHPKAHQKICAASDTFSRNQFPNKREQALPRFQSLTVWKSGMAICHQLSNSLIREVTENPFCVHFTEPVQKTL